MGLFGGKEEKRAKIENELLEKYGLQQIDSEDLESVQKILNELIGIGERKKILTLKNAKEEEQVKVAYLSGLYEQNWIIIRQLDRLNKQISSLKE